MRIPCIPVWIKAMLTAVILVLLVKTFAFTSCTIPSTGMENSLYQGERVLVNKWSYGFRVPFSIWRWLGKTAGKGDIVLFNNPNPRSPQTSVGNREVFISRVVGVPGDTLIDVLLGQLKRVGSVSSVAVIVIAQVDVLPQASVP